MTPALPSGITTSRATPGTADAGGCQRLHRRLPLSGSGTLSISNPVALGPAGSAGNFQGGTLQVTGTAVTDLNAYNVNSSGAGPSATWADFPLNLDVNNINGTFTSQSKPQRHLSLTKTGAGTLILGGTNTYSGGTYINAGILEVPTLDSAGTGPVIDGGGILELTANCSPGQNLTSNGNLAMTGNTTIGSISGFPATATVAANVIFYARQVRAAIPGERGTTTIGCGGSVSSISGAGSLTVRNRRHGWKPGHERQQRVKPARLGLCLLRLANRSDQQRPGDQLRLARPGANRRRQRPQSPDGGLYRRQVDGPGLWSWHGRRSAGCFLRSAMPTETWIPEPPPATTRS